MFWHPFHKIAGHVHHSTGAGTFGEGADFHALNRCCCPKGSGAGRCHGQTVVFACFGTQSVAVRSSAIPVVAEHWKRVAIRRRTLVVVGLCPVRDLVLGHDAAFGPELGVVVTGVVAKLVPVGVGHFKLCDVKGIQFERCGCGG